jgi:hypothetical protein
VVASRDYVEQLAISNYTLDARSRVWVRSLTSNDGSWTAWVSLALA